jgi:Family of unknown function (DUF6476)
MSDSMLRAVKLFVVVGGVLIIAGTATLIALMVKRGSQVAEPATPDPIGPSTVALPPGGEVTHASVAGRELVLLGRAREGQFVLVVELAGGERRRLIWLAPAKP